jgi:hypothetical protein
VEAEHHHGDVETAGLPWQRFELAVYVPHPIEPSAVREEARSRGARFGGIDADHLGVWAGFRYCARRLADAGPEDEDAPRGGIERADGRRQSLALRRR